MAKLHAVSVEKQQVQSVLILLLFMEHFFGNEREGKGRSSNVQRHSPEVRHQISI